MALDVGLIRESFQLISPSADKLVERFYEILFDRYSDVRPLFVHVRMPEQRQALLRSIARVVRNLENAQYLDDYLQGLGRIHLAFKTEPEHYDAVGECLIAAMSEVAGSKWTDQTEEAWTEAFGVIKLLMLKGAAQSASSSA